MFTPRPRPFFVGLTLGLGVLCFALGAWSSQIRIEQEVADNDKRIADLRDRLARSVLETRRARRLQHVGTDGARTPDVISTDGDPRSALVDEIKQQLQSEMGLLPIRVLRERRKSFVEVNAFDGSEKVSYCTAGYLGNGYFITVKHGVIALKGDDTEQGFTAVKVLYHDKSLLARVVDRGNADVEVHSGDWAILKVREEIDLPPLQIDTNYPYDFAEPIIRLGNDYSKGIILSTGYIGQRMDNGLVSTLTDGHPGVSGGGVLDGKGNLVGISIGRMDGDYRFSFILPLRPEMFKKIAPPLRDSDRSPVVPIH